MRLANMDIEGNTSGIPKQFDLAAYKQRPEPLTIQSAGNHINLNTQGTSYLQRALEIPREVVGLVIGTEGKKIKELCTLSGKIK